MKNSNSLFLGIVIGLSSCIISCQQTARLQEKSQNPASASSAKEQINQVLEAQSSCWSKGDLDCYMAGYWKSDSLVFIGKSGLTYGWQPTLENYKKGYPDAAAMGKLTFNILEMNPLSAETMFVIGKWHLKREVAAGDLQGHFSVIFKRFPDGWKIIADHSS